MLSNHHCQLLTAYIDGELDASERTIVNELLASTPEARAFLEKLECDSKELHRLPTRRAPETLVNLVMETVCDDVPRPRPVPLPAAPKARTIPRWLGVSIAVAVLAAVAALTFVLAR